MILNFVFYLPVAMYFGVASCIYGGRNIGIGVCCFGMWRLIGFFGDDGSKFWGVWEVGGGVGEDDKKYPKLK
jgi:hypothetical protein